MAVATTRNLLQMAKAEGIVVDGEAVWARMVAAIPTANPASILTVIDPVTNGPGR